MKRKPTKRAEPKPLADVPPGALAARLAEDIRGLVHEGMRYRMAYTRLHEAIQELKKQTAYKALEKDLVALLGPPTKGV